MPYSQITLAQFRNEILTAMHAGNGGPGSYWSSAEVEGMISESLRLWGLFTAYWRDRGVFQTAPNKSFYDLSVLLPNLRTRTTGYFGNSYRVQTHLGEPATGTAGTGMSAQFTIASILDAITRTRNDFVLDARLPYSILPVSPIPTPPEGRVSLPQNIAALGRVSWQDATSKVYRVLRRENAYSMDAASPSWTINPTLPYAFSAAETTPVTIQLYPPPINSGSLEVIAIQSLIPTTINDGTILSLPNEFQPAIAWGALASLLSTQNEGYDPARAKYCLERYNQIVQFASMQSSVIRVRINDVPIQLDTLASLDGLRPNWRNQLGRPNLSACIYDLLALSLTPDKIYGVTCDVIRTAPLPTGPDEFLQVGSEELPYLFNYCRHALSFKLGGTEFTSTMPLLDDFMQGAKQRSGLLKIQARHYTSLFGQPAKELANAPAA